MPADSQRRNSITPSDTDNKVCLSNAVEYKGPKPNSRVHDTFVWLGLLGLGGTLIAIGVGTMQVLPVAGYIFTAVTAGFICGCAIDGLTNLSKTPASLDKFEYDIEDRLTAVENKLTNVKNNTGSNPLNKYSLELLDNSLNIIEGLQTELSLLSKKNLVNLARYEALREIANTLNNQVLAKAEIETFLDSKLV